MSWAGGLVLSWVVIWQQSVVLAANVESASTESGSRLPTRADSLNTGQFLALASLVCFRPSMIWLHEYSYSNPLAAAQFNHRRAGIDPAAGQKNAPAARL
jgi:hypothetical protein